MEIIYNGDPVSEFLTAVLVVVFCTGLVTMFFSLIKIALNIKRMLNEK